MKRLILVLCIVMLTSVMNCVGAAASAAVEAKDTDTSFVVDGVNAYDDLIDRISDKAADAINGITEIREDQTTDILEQLGNSPDVAKTTWMYVLYVANSVNSMYWFIFVLSEVIGLVMALLSTRNKKRRKFAILFLCITLPLVILPLSTKGLFYLYEAFVGTFR